jgi:hypothetical protein
MKRHGNKASEGAEAIMREIQNEQFWQRRDPLSD